MELLTGRIYIIRSPNTEMVYVGSTILSLKVRFSVHVSQWRHNSCTSTSYLILEKGDAYIELIEEVLVESERELDMIEQIWINNTPNTVNMKRAYTTDEERIQKHRDCSREYGREHKEKVAEVNKKYYEANKEECLEQRKIYRETHREEINARAREKIRCEVCDKLISKSGKAKHVRTKNHIRNLEMSS